MHRCLTHPIAKPVVFVLACLPLAWLFWAAVADQLGANPAEALIRSLGDWSLRFLVLGLTITPLRVLAGWTALARFRRMLGLFVFFYVCMHLLAYAWFDMGFDPAAMLLDAIKRPFILVGAIAWFLLWLMAATSFNRAIRALGTRRWQLLHRSVYAVAALAVLHFFWMRSGKNDFNEVAVYAAILGSLLGWRLWRRFGHRSPGQ
ncbi:MAG: protein-methionine-sulfoxide reductase heme-binding subunit MsrQ [Hydrogenophaga sp.]|nr:protein-methionine-sulfoxide reductase heme-binding subunit MsrQ [Hydrogenophaga sp.]MDO9483151.1 protein-methionine-sulfoxide reductase heme-binding subunit MsrQ [Hydrogenophaga sp.]MDP3343446.1 protein-methionine-sulfoxide reductase heme-binding subunit MsrQ [Hydrogenophaga sp.]MDP3806301.1 protein-methionine-sulfoxide reductase heme-binding subunit MsrQ [Hydrogenophaga sp.]